MGEKQKYGIDFKLHTVGKYGQGKCGYKRLAREFGLPRNTVRDKSVPVPLVTSPLESTKCGMNVTFSWANS